MQSVGAKPMDHFGLEAFLLGPIGLFAGHFSWLANPFLWISWTKRNVSSRSGAAIWAVVSLLVAISFFLPKTIAVGNSGWYSYQPAMGFYLWIGSMSIALLSACLHPAYVKSAEIDTEILEK